MTQSTSTKTSGGANFLQSSKNSEKLRIDFYESSDGETIILEFPDGGLGIVDAHPSANNSRPSILDLVKGRRVHFVCLTHPHADHGVDLIPVLQRHSPIGGFWHTNPDVSSFVYHCVTERPNYPAAVRRFVNDLADGWADFLLDLYSSVDSLVERRLHSRVQPESIAGVRIWFLGPDEQVAKKFMKAYKTRASGSAKGLPSPNLLSAILAIEYGGVAVLLGGDALKAAWQDAIRVYAANRVPRALVIKVPHHGAGNALSLERNKKNYLDLCSKEAVSILFAGDSKHPNPRVSEELRRRTRLICLSNGLKGAHGNGNPLGLNIVGARQVRASYMCQPQITIEVATDGTMTIPRGASCPVCQ